MPQTVRSMGLSSTSDTTPKRSSGKLNKQAASAAAAKMDGQKNGQQPKTGWTKKLSDRAGILAGQKPPTRVASPGTTVRMVGEKLGAVNLHDNLLRTGDIPPLPSSRKGKERVAGFTDSPAPSIRGSPYDGSLSSSRSTIRLTTQPVQQSPASRPASILSRSSHVSYTPSEASNHTLTRETVAAIDAVSRRYSATSDSVYGYENETDRGSVYSQEEMRPASPAPPVPRLPDMHFSQELRTVSSLGAPERPSSMTSSRPSTSTSSRRGPWSALAGTLDTNLPRTFPSNYPRDDYYGNYDSPEDAISPSFLLESEFSRTRENTNINMDYSPAASSFEAPTNSPVGGSEAGYKHWHDNPIGNNNSMLFIRDQLRGSIPRDDETCGSEAGETYRGYRYERPGSVMTSISRRGPTKAYHIPGGYDGNNNSVSSTTTPNAYPSTRIDDRVPDLPSLPPLPPSPHPQDARRRESSGSSAITSLESPSSYRTPHSRVSSRTTPSPPGRQKNVAPTVAPLEVRKNGIRQLMLPAASLAGNRPSDVNLERDSDYHTSSARRGSAGTHTNYNSVVMDGNISKLNALMSRYSERIYDDEVQRFVEHLVEELTKTVSFHQPPVLPRYYSEFLLTCFFVS